MTEKLDLLARNFEQNHKTHITDTDWEQLVKDELDVITADSKIVDFNETLTASEPFHPETLSSTTSSTAYLGTFVSAAEVIEAIASRNGKKKLWH